MADSKAPANTPAKKKPAPPSHDPTPVQRDHVEKLAQIGLPQSDIALVIGISESTLKRKYKTELAKGGANGKIGVLTTLHQQAMGRPAEFDGNGRTVRAEVKPNPIVGIFLGKTRCGLKETTGHEHTGKDGKPIKTDTRFKVVIAPEDDAV